MEPISRFGSMAHVAFGIMLRLDLALESCHDRHDGGGGPVGQFCCRVVGEPRILDGDQIPLTCVLTLRPRVAWRLRGWADNIECWLPTQASL